MRNPMDIASFTTGITEELHRIGQLLIQETLEEMDQMICGSGKRKQNYWDGVLRGQIKWRSCVTTI